jgi:LmbE family N-acetylglucosaminyl deacetylase
MPDAARTPPPGARFLLRATGGLRWLTGAGGDELPGRVVALSVHLDDAVLSVGAALARAARRGGDVSVLTVLAGDPQSSASAGPWDRRAGFATAGEAAARRRAEDRGACELLGIRPTWLRYSDHQYQRGGSDEEIAADVAREAGDADIVLVPAYPLSHPDHAWLAALLAGVPFSARVGRYVEQPYAVWEGAPPEPYRRLAATARDRVAKLRAARAYTSQLGQLDERVVLRTARYEAARGGEAVNWRLVDAEDAGAHDGPADPRDGAESDRA